MAKSKQYAVLGMGIFGQSVAKELSESGCEVLVVDKDHDVIQYMAEFVTHAVHGNFSEEHLLQSIGIGNFDVVIVAISTNLEDSILASLLVKEMGVPYVLAKASDSLQKKILEKIGVDRVVLPEMEIGTRTAQALLSEKVLDFFDITSGFRIAEIAIHKEWIGKSISQSGLRSSFGLNIVGVKRGTKVELNIEPSTMLHDGDILVVIGENHNIDRLCHSQKK